MGTKTFFKDLQNPSFYPHALSQSLSVIILFCPLSLLPFGGGGGSYLTLICSVVSFREMTRNSRGKGQLFLFPSFESQFTAPEDVFVFFNCEPSQVCHVVSESLSWKPLKRTPHSCILEHLHVMAYCKCLNQCLH